MSEWYALAPGDVGDPIDDDLLDASPTSEADALAEAKRRAAAPCHGPCRVVRITEVAVFAAPIVKTGAAGDALKRE